MNYLAHFHLAGNQEGFVLGALLGDFVKGNLQSKSHSPSLSTPPMPSHVIAGIQLHRNLDGYFDRQTAKSKGFALTTHRYRRYLPIALDLFFDYALSTNWHQFEQVPLQGFQSGVLKKLAPYQAAMPNSAKLFFERLEKHQLLQRYGDKEFLRRVAKHISVRLPSGNSMLATFDEVLEKEAEFIHYFKTSYPALQRFAQEQRITLSSTTS